jgi:hypothetical protein
LRQLITPTPVRHSRPGCEEFLREDTGYVHLSQGVSSVDRQRSPLTITSIILPPRDPLAVPAAAVIRHGMFAPSETGVKTFGEPLSSHWKDHILDEQLSNILGGIL